MTEKTEQVETEAKLKAKQAKLETKLRNERTNLRRLFTVSANIFDEIHRKVDIEKDIHVQYNKIIEKAERLFKVDEEIKDLIDLTNEEYDTVESNRDRFTEIRVIYEKYYNQQNETSSVVSNKCTPDNLQMPKLRLKEYDLMPRSWVAFWGQFCRIDEDENLLALVNSKTNIKLSDLYDKLGSYLRALETLGVTTSNFAAMLYPVVESCLPVEILKAWDRHRLNREVKEDSILTTEKVLENLMSFLRHEVEGEEHRVLAETAFGNGIKRKDIHKPVHKDETTAATLIANSSAGENNCVFCDRSHPSQECRKISNMNYDDRKRQVMLKRCCLVCLKSGHMAKKCHSNVRCLICERRQYALLCPDLRKGNSSLPKRKVADEEAKSTEILLTNHSSEYEIYLKTIIVRVRHKGKEVCVRALMDDGSHRSYIEKSLVAELNLSPSGTEVLSQGLFGGGISTTAEHGRFSVTVESLDRKYSTSVALLDQPKICSTLPKIRDKTLLTKLASRGIVLTDVGRDTPPIRILLGADVLGSILTGRIEVFASGLSAVETLLGWTILGLGKKKQAVNMVTLSLQNLELPKIWDLEVLDIKDPVERKNKTLLEEETLIHFKETIRFQEDQRYEVALPWLAGHPPVYDKYDVAESRLRSVTKRLGKENIYEVYDDVLRQWQKEGIIETIPENEISMAGHYLPHRPVIKSSSLTTKVRPVFDASFKQPGYSSLNECLSAGPSLSEQISPLLLRFCTNAIGVIADIKQAFLQLSVRPEDRNFLRFLWWNTEDRTKLEFFRHCRVVFGVTSSPFLLNASVRHHLDSTEYQIESLQATVKKLKRGFYVDNLTISVENQQELLEFKAQTMKIMNAASFELRCWAHTGTKHSETQNVLGLKWDTETDELYCEAWRNKLDWDEGLTLDMQLRYRRWAKHIAIIEKCRIPRRILYGNFKKATLHIFTDASVHGYACCSFLRCEDEEEGKVSLISSKARVAPVQRPTIPRLELLGAAIGARIASTILEALDLPLKTYFWTDSMIVLGWITNTEPWNTFVGNRVKEIRELTKMEDWRFVPGDVNPADLPSRSCNWFELLQSRWWEGPKWLYEPPEFWPYTEITLLEEAMKERRKSVVVNLNIDTKEHFGNRLLYFSSYPRIIRMIAWILRFCQNIRVSSHKLTKELSYEEIQSAEEALIRIIQSEWPTDIQEKYAQTIQFYEENKILKERATLLCECESIVNGRPLTYIYDDPNELRAIKPSDFIQDIKGNETMDLDIVDAKHLRKRIRYLQNLRYQLRQRFQKEYLSELIRSPQSFSKRRNLSPGDIVLVGSDNTKRLNWPLGRIIELFKGKGNVERVARLRVAKGEIIRPIQRIYPLELSSSEILNDVPVRVKDSSDISDNDNQHTVSNEQSFEPKDSPKEQLETLKRSRFGRQIIPVKRLDL
ncbi:reverse transcriptase [Caerostris darwini]|uniref:Reverse transcriptase n=1 Tax=Caerostris darwini TaxID=1538125 RepID=A0AAV4PE10_9ARAC|nr:reverse transcriptase [Caerostris darwini]